MSQQDVINLAIESYLQHMNNIGQRFQADRTLIPAHRQAPNVVRNPKTASHSPSSDRILNSKSLMGDRTLQHICKVHKTPTQSQPCKRAAIANTRQPVFSATDYRWLLINLQPPHGGQTI
jgi:hypothetical protein